MPRRRRGGCVPGAPYYCYKCGNCDPSYSPTYSNKKPVHKTTTSTTQQDKFNTGENISNVFVGSMKTAVNLIGKDLEATSAAALSSASYAVTAPVAITFHWINPGLTASQKWIMTGIEALNAVGGVILAFTVANYWNPFGWSGALVCLEYGVISWMVTNTIQGSFIEENKKNGIV